MTLIIIKMKWCWIKKIDYYKFYDIFKIWWGIGFINWNVCYKKMMLSKIIIKVKIIEIDIINYLKYFML